MKPDSKHVPAKEEKAESRGAQLVHKWISSRLRKIAGRGVASGLASTLFALPALAQASDQDLEEYQFAEVLPGVRSVQLLSNGDVQLRMADGRIILVSADDVRVLDNGAIMVAEDVAVEVAQFAVAAEAVGTGAAAGGGVGAAGAVLGGLGLAGAAAAGGGGGDEEAAVPTAAKPKTLNLAQLQGTSLNSTSANATAPEGTATVEVTIGSVTKTVSAAGDGSWSVSLTQVEAAGLPQGVNTVSIRNLDVGGAEISVETSTFSIDTVPPTLAITGFSDGVVMNAAESATDLTIIGSTNAENGQTVTVGFNGQTYTGTVSGGVWAVTVPAADLTTLSDGATVTATADVEDRAGNPAAQASGSIDTDFSSPVVSIDTVAGGQLDLIDVSGDLTITGTTTAEDGQTVTLSFDGQSYSGAASGGLWSLTIPKSDLAALTTGNPAVISVAVEDAAGNPSSTVSVSVPVDLSGPSITITPLSVGSVLNASEVGADLTINGTTGNVTDGQTVSVSLGGQTYTGSVTGGAWSVTVPSADLIALADSGNFAVTADVTDSDGIAAPQAGISVSKDATPPSVSIDTFSHGAVLNAAEQGVDLTITGATTAEDGQTVSVGMNGQSYTAAASGGVWSVTVPAIDLAGLTDGTTVSVTVDVSDAAGNPAVQATGSFDTDFTAPLLTVDSLSTGGVLNLSEQAGDLTVTGASNAADGTPVLVQIARADGTVDVTGTATVSGGAWTYTTAVGELSVLQDSETYSVTVSVSDAAGNTRVTSTGFTTDFVAPSVALDPLSIGTVLDVVEKGSDLSISGTTTAEDGQTVTVNLGAQTYTTTALGGTWSTTVPTADLVLLADGGTYTVTASVADAAGNPSAPATTTFVTDYRPLLSINDVGTNDAIALTEAQSSGWNVGGTSAGLNFGQSVDVTLNSVSVGTASIAADGTWTLAVPSAVFAGLDAGDPLDFVASATVSGGPSPIPATDQAVAHESAEYFVTEVGRSGATVTFEIHVDANRDTSGGLAFSADLAFDPAVVSYDSGSEFENGDFDLFLANPSGAAAISFAGAATSFGDLSQPVVTFSMTVLDPSKPIALTITTPDGGPSHWQLGTDGADTLVASDMDDVIRGGDGDDTIDLSGAGRDLIVFEADPAANGTDTITGFMLGPATDVSDGLMFNGLDISTLRGNGSGFETLGLGDLVGTNTGFVGLTSTLADLGLGTLTTAAESLTGTQAGDEIYLLATDGNDSLLVKVDYTAPNSATVQTVAQFEGLAHLGSLNGDNILHTDPTGAST